MSFFGCSYFVFPPRIVQNSHLGGWGSYLQIGLISYILCLLVGESGRKWSAGPVLGRRSDVKRSYRTDVLRPVPA